MQINNKELFFFESFLLEIILASFGNSSTHPEIVVEYSERMKEHIPDLIEEIDYVLTCNPLPFEQIINPIKLGYKTESEFIEWLRNMRTLLHTK